MNRPMDMEYTPPPDEADDLDLSAFLGSLQLADSVFPSGLYALSYGLEAFVQTGLLRPPELEALLADYLRHGIGPADGAALACAHRAGEDGALGLAVEADLRLTAVKLPREPRDASRRTGRQLLATARQVFGGALLEAYSVRVTDGEAPANHAVIQGMTMATLGIRRKQALAGYLYGFTSGALASLVRLAAIDHRFAQAVLHALKPVIEAVTLSHCDSEIRDIESNTPIVDVMSMQHERAHLRLFIT